MSQIQRRLFDTAIDFTNTLQVKAFLQRLSQQLDDLVGAVNSIPSVSATPIAGDVMLYGSDARIPLGAMPLVWDSGTLATQTQYITSPTLSGLSDGGYKIFFFFEQGSNNTVNFGINLDRTLTDYNRDHIDISAATPAYTSDNASTMFTFANASDFIYGQGDIIFSPAGRVAFNYTSRISSTARHYRSGSISKIATVTNITQVEFFGGGANTFGANSRVLMFRIF